MNFILPIIAKISNYISVQKQSIIEKMSMETDLRIENEKLRRRIKELESTIKKSSSAKARKSKLRILDFTKYKMRHIALKFCYLGWSYCGLAQQRNEENTVIEKIFEALELCKLIDNRDDSNIVVCGRTDKGVSAFQQVISLNVRSNLVAPRGLIENTGVNIDQRKKVSDDEIDYVFLLNKVLPNDIRMLAWSPVDLDFSARFNCTSRSYKYFFTRSDLCLDAMRDAGQRLIGEHDFRNFCSMQINQGITQYVRRIYEVRIEPFDESEHDNEYRMYVIHIRASSFIYHQIRCIVAVLLMVGQGREHVDIIDQLLDIGGVGGLGKPLYPMASDLPLVFYDSSYDDIDWHTSTEAVSDCVNTVQRLWVNHQTKQTILKLFLDNINRKHSSDIDKSPLINAIIADMKPENWKPLLKRQKEKTLEEKIEMQNMKKAKSCN